MNRRIRPMGLARFESRSVVSFLISVIRFLQLVIRRNLDMRLAPATSEDHQSATMTIVIKIK